MFRPLFLVFVLTAAPAFAQGIEPGPLIGTVDGKTYISPTGAFKVTIPVLPELGGRITDTDNVVIFQDNFNVLCTIAAFPMDATQRWECSTRGTKEYLAYFFANFVMRDMQNAFRGARVQGAVYSPSIAGGSLLTFVLLPGGSMFAQKLAFVDPRAPPPEAKRGNLAFVHNNFVFVLSIELAEHVLERKDYHKTPEEEDEILRKRLIDLLNRMTLSKPPPATGSIVEKLRNDRPKADQPPAKDAPKP